MRKVKYDSSPNACEVRRTRHREPIGLQVEHSNILRSAMQNVSALVQLRSSKKSGGVALGAKFPILTRYCRASLQSRTRPTAVLGTGSGTGIGRARMMSSIFSPGVSPLDVRLMVGRWPLTIIKSREILTCVPVPHCRRGVEKRTWDAREPSRLLSD